MKHASKSIICACLAFMSCKKDPAPWIDFSAPMFGTWHYDVRLKNETSNFGDFGSNYSIIKYHYQDSDFLYLYPDSTYTEIISGDTSFGRWSVSGYTFIMTQWDTSVLTITKLNKNDLVLSEGKQSLIGDTLYQSVEYIQVLKRIK